MSFGRSWRVADVGADRGGEFRRMNLTEEMQAVVANLREREWIQVRCAMVTLYALTARVQTRQGLRPGDEHIIRAVMRTKG